jgi:alpha-L-rhamnosidase
MSDLKNNQKRDLLPVGGTPIQPEDSLCHVAWQAEWMQDPVFEGVAPRELISPNRCEENNGELRNLHTLFRRETVLPTGAIRQARLYITADDGYKLYLNGAFIGLGPAPAYPFDYPYNAWDVTDQLAGGERPSRGRGLERDETECVGMRVCGSEGGEAFDSHTPTLAHPHTLQVTGRPLCIAVHAFYHGLHCLTVPSGDNLQGVLLQLEIEYEDGTTARVTSDRHWRCTRTDAYEARQLYGYQTSFSEHIDLRKLPVGWMQPGFDDSDWQCPATGPVPQVYTLKPQETPPVSVTRRAPVRIVRKGEGLDGPESVRYKMRCNCTYQEFCTLSGRADELLTFFDYKGFRYVELLNWPEELTEERIWVWERHYPFPAEASRFTCTNPLLADIWQLCRNGVRVGTLDNYLDCPTREKGGFMGDGFVTGISHLILTGDPRILRKFLRDVANTSRYCPGLFSTAPNYISGEIAEYSLLWPVLLDYYYQWTCDREFVREMLPVLAGLLTYYAAYENRDGLLQDIFSQITKSHTVMVDWPKNLRDDYDDPHLPGSPAASDAPTGVVNTMVQGFYSCALQAAQRLAGVVGEQSLQDLTAGKVDRHRDAVLDQLRSPATGLFIDRNGSAHSALHANVTPLMAGMLDGDDRSAVIDLIREKRLSCGVYFSFFVLKSLFEAGEAELAYDLITSRDLHSWHSMLEAGATTCMEAWAPDLKWNTSWCHPWSSAPIAMITHELMGLRPAEPGWRTVRFAPRPPATLDAASIAITTPLGELCASFQRTGEEIAYRLELPAGSRATCEFDPAVSTIRVDGAEAPSALSTNDRGLACRILNSTLKPGVHEIACR